MGVGGQPHAPAALPLEKSGTHCIGGWVGLRASLNPCGKSRPHRDSIPWNVQPVAQSLYRLSYPGSQELRNFLKSPKTELY